MSLTRNSILRPRRHRRTIVVIARTGKGSHQANRLKYLIFEGSVAGDYLGDINVPVIYGHAGATHAISVAAYDVNRAPFSPDPPYTPEIEDFTSAGPFINAFDARGRRLFFPEVRQKPDIACVDGGLYDVLRQRLPFRTIPTPRFFGTSAAAPCAAGIGALLLEKSERRGSRGRLNDTQMLALLKNTTPTRNPSPFLVTGQTPVGRKRIRVCGCAGRISGELWRPDASLRSPSTHPARR